MFWKSDSGRKTQRRKRLLPAKYRTHKARGRRVRCEDGECTLRCYNDETGGIRGPDEPDVRRLKLRSEPQSSARRIVHGEDPGLGPTTAGACSLTFSSSNVKLLRAFQARDLRPREAKR